MRQGCEAGGGAGVQWQAAEQARQAPGRLRAAGAHSTPAADAACASPQHENFGSRATNGACECAHACSLCDSMQSHHVAACACCGLCTKADIALFVWGRAHNSQTGTRAELKTCCAGRPAVRVAHSVRDAVLCGHAAAAAQHVARAEDCARHGRHPLARPRALQTHHHWCAAGVECTWAMLGFCYG